MAAKAWCDGQADADGVFAMDPPRLGDGRHE